MAPPRAPTIVQLSQDGQFSSPRRPPARWPSGVPA